MVQFCVPSKLKAIRKTSSELIGKFIIKKKIELYFPFSFLLFLSHLETSHFLYRASINEKPLLQSNEAQWTKNIVFRELFMFFLASILSFCIFNWNSEFLFEVSLIFWESYGMDSLTKSAISSIMSIKWTYLVLWGDS